MGVGCWDAVTYPGEDGARRAVTTKMKKCSVFCLQVFHGQMCMQPGCRGTS